MSIMAARVVDLPLPVSPVTRTKPWCRSVSSSTLGGRSSFSKAGISSASRRMAAEKLPCWRNRFTRTRRPTMVRARSTSPTAFSCSS